MSEQDLIVITKPEVGLRIASGVMRSVASFDLNSLDRFMSDENVGLKPLFGNEDRVHHQAALGHGTNHAELSRFYIANAPDERLASLAEALRQQSAVEAAYVKPRASLPYRPLNLPAANTPLPQVTESYLARQGYLDDSPRGVDARFAWTIPGGMGDGVRIADVELSWRLTHEKLRGQDINVLGPSQDRGNDWSHGTAVLGVLNAAAGDPGITGIAPLALAQCAVDDGAPGLTTSSAVFEAATQLLAGDILILEAHAPGPRNNFTDAPGPDPQVGYIPMEWFPDDQRAIRFATARGIIVIAAAGNGSQNLDDGLYDQRFDWMPAWWRNPFRRGLGDTGSLLVGAGAPPPGFHGPGPENDHGPDRSRLAFSNFGAAVDAQGWGEEVTTAGGYGELQGAQDPATWDRWYTDRFNGTSSATPCVAGALACVQGILRARGVPLLTPAHARDLLRTTGAAQMSPAGGPVTERIGNRPSIRQMLARLGVP